MDAPTRPMAPGANVVCTFTNTATPPPAPDLGITKVGVVTSSALGQFITYTVTVTNQGTASAPGPIIVSDALPSTPAGLLFSGASGTCSGPPAGPIVCSSATVGDPAAPLAPGAQLTYTITLAVPAPTCVTLSMNSESPAAPVGS